MTRSLRARPLWTAHLAAAVVGCSIAVLAASPAEAAVSWTSCTAVQQTYPHGVGRTTAKDRTSGVPVTSFTKNNAIYAAAVKARPGLDRDKDGIACEKR